MTQPTETPRCHVVVYDPPVTKPGPYTGELRRCNRPLDTPTGGPCVTCWMVVSVTALDGDSHLRAEGHVYASPLGCSIHGATTDGGREA